MGRKDRERFQRNRDANPDYAGYRGPSTVTVRAPSVASPATETVVCSVCNRKRNVASDSLPEDVSAYVCLSCQDEGGDGSG